MFMTTIYSLLSVVALALLLAGCDANWSGNADPTPTTHVSSDAATEIVSDRQRISLGWDYLEVSAESVADARAQTPWQRIDVPHTWNAFDTTDTVAGYRRDASWYRKHVSLARSLDRRYFLHFEAAQMKAVIYVNGEKAGEHIGGYVSFDIEITEQVVDGSNEILVRVDNSIDTDLVPSQKADFFQYGGLTRDVWLLTKPLDILRQVHINFPEVSADSARIELKMITDTQSEYSPAGYYSDIIAPDGSVVASGSGRTFTIDKPALWSPDTPSLYTLKTSMLDSSGGVVSRFEDQFGLRWFGFKPHGAFYLNGERLLLRGTHLHEDHAGFGAAMPDEQRIADMRQIKTLGANFIRLGHYPQDPVVYDEADRLGLILWDEIPWNRGGVGQEQWRNNTQYLLRRMIEQNYNRPSIFFWGLGNEMNWDPDSEGSNDPNKVRAELEALQKIAKGMDATRLTTIRKFTEGADVVDVYSPSIWMGWYGGGYHQYEGAIAKYRREVPALLHMEFGGSSHVGRHLEKPFGGGGVSGPGAQLSVEEAVNQAGVTSVAKSYVWDETYIVDLFDWTLRHSETDQEFSGSAQWAFKDFGTPIRPENAIPFVNQKGLVDRSGRPKDAYHVFASYWKKDPVCWIESDTWTHRSGRRDEEKVLSVFCNTYSAQLFLNDTPLDTKVRDVSKFPASGLTWNIVFEEGENTLRVAGYNEQGAVSAEHRITVNYELKKPGKLRSIALTTHSNDDGTLSVLAEALDKNGLRCTSCAQTLYFTHDGGGKLIDNLGTPTGSRKVQLANGSAQIGFLPGVRGARIGVQTQDFKGRYIWVPAQ